MNKWRRKARMWRKRNERVWDLLQRTSEQLAAALNQVDEYRRQGNEAIREVTDQREGLLAWRRGVREAWHTQPNTGDAVRDFITWANDLRRAIEGEAGKEQP